MICAFRDGPPQLLDRQVVGQGRWAFLSTESTGQRRPTYTLTRVWRVMRKSSEELEGELGSDWTRNYPIFRPFFPGFTGRGVGCGLRPAVSHVLAALHGVGGLL